MKKSNHWPRAIIHLDMNAFFASIEQQKEPKLQGKPVAITNGDQGSCIITCSYEARAYGVHTGMRMREALRLCPKLIRVAARPKIYADISRTIMAALADITPDIEIFSVDEAFLDVTRCQKLLGPAETIAYLAKTKVYEVSGLPCSVGLSGDKTTAKYASKQHKPNGITIIKPEDAKEYLAEIPVTELCGIAHGTAKFLARYGVVLCGDMEKVPISILAKRFGNWGRRIWYMCQGQDPDRVTPHNTLAKSLGHSKVIPPNTQEKQTVLTYFLHLTKKLSARLREHELQAQTFYIGIKNYQLGWFAIKLSLAQPGNSQHLIFKLCKNALTKLWIDAGVSQIQLTALDPRPSNQQSDLFANATTCYKFERLEQTCDEINNQYDNDIIKPARLLHEKITKSPITPAWQPMGCRKTI